jgi:serine/threonine-protein kinase HipA
LVSIGERSVLLLDRFDRQAEQRVGYLSALSLVQGQDGQSRDYLEVAEALAVWSVRPADDLRQLWRRIAFNVAINNTDDHLRNLGLLRPAGGWRLAPAFDLTPNPETGRSRATALAGADQPADTLQALVDGRSDFMMSAGAVREALTQVRDAVSGWARIAAGYQIHSREVERFRPTFTAGEEALDVALSSLS